MLRIYLILLFLSGLFPAIALCLDDSLYRVDSILIVGNKKTKEYVIMRELTFQTQAYYTQENLAEKLTLTRANLLKLQLFNFVTIDTVLQQKNYTVTINVIERWYIFPYLIIQHSDRNFSEWVQKHEWDRVNYGVSVNKFNFMGRNETLRFTFIGGFTQQFSVGYYGRYLDKKRRHSLSFDGSFLQQDAVNYETVENKPNRYSSQYHNVLETSKLGVSYNFRPDLYNFHSIRAEYNLTQISDTVLKLNPAFLGTGENKANYGFFVYNFVSDHRNSKYYPVNGYLYGISLRNSIVFGNNNVKNFSAIELSFVKFNTISRLWDISVYAKIKKSIGKNPPYYINKGLGYGSDQLRGFEYYIVEGQDFAVAKTMLRFNVLPTKITEIGWIPLTQFRKIHYSIYMNVFFDWGYALDYSADITYHNNYLTNSSLYSSGFGIDFVTYYDKVVRLDYSINSLGEKGVFLHFFAAIR